MQKESQGASVNLLEFYGDPDMKDNGQNEDLDLLSSAKKQSDLLTDGDDKSILSQSAQKRQIALGTIDEWEKE